MAKQPVIERLGLEPVPAEQKNTTWKEYFIIQLAFSVNAGNFLIPALAVIEGGLSFTAAFFSTVFGALAAFLCVSYLSLPGSRYGLPAQYVLRTLIGTRLSMLVASPIRSLTSLYWFSVQTIGGTYVLLSIMEKVAGITYPFIPVAVVLAVIMTILALVGFHAVKKATKYFIPVLVAGQIVILYLFLTKGLSTGTLNTLNDGTKDASIATCFFYSSLVFVQYVSGVSASSDMTRYSKSSAHGFWGLYAGNVVGFMMTALLGGLSAALFGELNPFVAAGEITSSLFLLIIITACAMVSMISINLSNAYTGGYSLLNALPKLSRIQSAAVFGSLGIILSSIPSLVKNAQDYISLLGILIIPISAIVTADYLFVRKGRIEEGSLLQLLNGTSMFNKEALYVLTAGMFAYILIPERYSPGFLSFIMTCVMYVLAKRRSNSVEQPTNYEHNVGS
ncbi:cytosine permease [Rossellomorea aquimaris]|uniref:purine-cytosine permease family protein n=1 Tax=Rossellomorea aquimaris TaxID=189382 RepID=UPI001CD6CF51|nr:cytosine permease [Rossellomorea aquimaris]MCA1056914.1 cytosine permease [Rossellomorea aquimaris]